MPPGPERAGAQTLVPFMLTHAQIWNAIDRLAARGVRVVELPEPTSEVDCPTQLLTDAGPFDVYEHPAEVLKRIEQATE